MATAPTLAAFKAYLPADRHRTDDEMQDALTTETLAQGRVCRIPAGTDPYPADLATALFRRVDRALAVKDRPLGYEVGIDGGMSYIGARDSEILRLEKPFRKRSVR